jgi:probable HAF family extracellular repeat protein
MELPCKLMSRGPYVGRILIVLALLCVATLQPAFGQSFNIVDLGTLPGGSFSEALGINNRGQVVGSSATASSFPHAFLFENGVMVDLGTLPGDNQSNATGINNHGQIVGDSETNGFISTPHAFLFDDGVMTDLGTLPGGTSSHAFDINDRGQVVGSATTVSGNTHAFLFENGVMVDLGTLPGGSFSELWASTTAARWSASRPQRPHSHTLFYSKTG